MDPVVVLFQPVRLSLGQRYFLLLVVHQSSEVVDVSLELLILLLQVLGECLLHGEITLQSAHFTVIEVDLVPLSALSLRLHVQLLLEAISLRLGPDQLLLQLFDPLVQHPAVGIISRLEALGLLCMVPHDVVSLLKLGLLLLDELVPLGVGLISLAFSFFDRL